MAGWVRGDSESDEEEREEIRLRVPGHDVCVGLEDVLGHAKRGASLAAATAVALLVRALRKAGGLTQLQVKERVAVSGELNLRGQMLPVGGIAEMVAGAHKAGCSMAILPAGNGPDVAAMLDRLAGGEEEDDEGLKAWVREWVFMAADLVDVMCLAVQGVPSASCLSPAHRLRVAQVGWPVCWVQGFLRLARRRWCSASTGWGTGAACARKWLAVRLRLWWSAASSALAHVSWW